MSLSRNSFVANISKITNSRYYNQTPEMLDFLERVSAYFDKLEGHPTYIKMTSAEKKEVKAFFAGKLAAPSCISPKHFYGCEIKRPQFKLHPEKCLLIYYDKNNDAQQVITFTVEKWTNRIRIHSRDDIQKFIEFGKQYPHAFKAVGFKNAHVVVPLTRSCSL